MISSMDIFKVEMLSTRTESFAFVEELLPPWEVLPETDFGWKP